MNTEGLQEKLTAFRHDLHQHPELSGQEKRTASRVQAFLQPTFPDKIYTHIGGHGLAFAYHSGQPGPVVMFRCELDALPIQESNSFDYASSTACVSHLCGHDGHMAILAGLGYLLAEEKPERGKVILLFQPAEETGQGALQVLQDPVWTHIQPDYLFALHNIPGLPRHQICSKSGVFAAASKGMVVKLTGATAHAAHPEQGKSPAMALAAILQAWEQLPSQTAHFQDFVRLTVVHALLGEIAFGVTPGYAELRATLRSFENKDMATLTQLAETVVRQQAARYGLTFDISYTEEFTAVVNNPEAYACLSSAAQACGLAYQAMEQPFRWSEDFGYFSAHTQTAFFGLGAGQKQPALHHASYDFPDEVILTGSRMCREIVKKILDDSYQIKIQ